MKTYGESAKPSNATKVPRTLKSALAKKKSRGPRLKKKVRFDLRKRLTPSDEAVYEECIAHCKRAGFNRPHISDETQLKSYSCEDVMRPELADSAKPWQSLTCLAPPSSPTNAVRHNSSRCWTGLSSPSRLTGPQATHGILQKSKVQSFRRSLNCKERILTPKWARNSTQMEQTQNTYSPEIASCANSAHSPRNCGEENLKSQAKITASSENSFKWSLPTAAFKEKIVGNERRFVVEELSTNIERLQIATKIASGFPRLEAVSDTSSPFALLQPKECVNFAAVDTCIDDSQEYADRCDDLSMDGDGINNDHFDKNNSSVEKRPKEGETSSTHNSSKNSGVLSSNLDDEKTEEELGTAIRSISTGHMPGAIDAVCDQEELSSTEPPLFDPNCSTSARSKPASSSKQASRNFLLERSCSADFIIAETFSACSRLSHNLELLVDPEEEIDEDFWRVVCPQNSSDHLTSQTPHYSFCFDESQAPSIENDKKPNTDASQSKGIGQGPSHCCDAVNVSVIQADNKNHSNAPIEHSLLNDHASYAGSCASKSEVLATSSVSQTRMPIRLTPAASSTTVSMLYAHDRPPSRGDTDAELSFCRSVSEVRTSVSQPENISDDVLDCSCVKAETSSFNYRMEPCHKSPGATQNEDINEGEEMDIGEEKTDVEGMTAEDKARPLLMCCVLNCGLQFSQPSLLNEHVAQMNHSPCNPLATILDGLEPSGDPQFLCPQCGISFENETSCLAHMFQVNHARLLLPVPSVVYACPECLRWFDDIPSAEQHMDTLSHHGVAFYFNEDGNAPHRGRPIPVPQRLVKELVARCRRVSHSLVCQDCGLGLADPAELRSHLDMRHIVVAKCCTSIRDVFADLLTDQACAECGQFIYQGLPSTGMCLHTGCPLQGPVLSWPARTLREFVLRCGITGIGVGTEYNLDCGTLVRRHASPLVMMAYRDDSSDFQTEAARADSDGPARSLSESALPLGDDAHTCNWLHFESGIKDAHTLLRATTEDFSTTALVASPARNEDVSLRGTPDSCLLPPCTEAIHAVSNHSFQGTSDPSLGCQNRSDQISFPSTSAARSSFPDLQVPCSSYDMQSSSNSEPQTTSCESCPHLINSHASCGTSSLTSSASSNKASLIHSFSRTMEIDSDGDYDADEEREGVGLEEKLSKELSYNTNAVSGGRIMTNRVVTGEPNVSASLETIPQKSHEKILRAPNVALGNDEMVDPESLLSEVNAAPAALSEESCMPLIGTSKKMVFGSGASLDKNFYCSQPLTSSVFGKSRDQSTQVESADNFDPSTASQACSKDCEQQTSSRHCAAPRLTATIIPQTDIIVISSQAQHSDGDENDVGSIDKEGREDANIRYFVIPKQSQHQQDKLKKRKSNQHSQCQNRQRGGKRGVGAKRSKRRPSSTKTPFGHRKRVSKSFHLPDLTALSKQRSSSTYTTPGSRRAASLSPNRELAKNTFLTATSRTMTEAFKQRPINVNKYNRSKKFEPTYVILHGQDINAAEQDSLDSRAKGLSVYSEVAGDDSSKKNLIDLVQQSTVKLEFNPIKPHKNKHEYNPPSSEEPRYYIVKEETFHSDMETQTRIANSTAQDSEQDRLNVGEPSAAESRYFILPRGPTSSKFDQGKYLVGSDSYEAGPSNAEPHCSYGGNLDGQYMLPRNLLPEHKYPQPFPEPARSSNIAENTLEQGCSLGEKLALRTKLAEMETKEKQIQEYFHSSDRFFAVGSAKTPRPSHLKEPSKEGKLPVRTDSRMCSSQNFVMETDTEADNDYDVENDRNRYFKTTGKVKPACLTHTDEEEGSSESKIVNKKQYSSKITRLINQLQSTNLDSDQEGKQKVGRHTSKNSLVRTRTAAGKVLSVPFIKSQKSNNPRKPLRGPLTRHRALCKAREIQATNKRQKKKKMRRRKPKRITATSKKLVKCKRRGKTILKRQRLLFQKLTLKCTAKMQRKQAKEAALLLETKFSLNKKRKTQTSQKIRAKTSRYTGSLPSANAMTFKRQRKQAWERQTEGRSGNTKTQPKAENCERRKPRPSSVRPRSHHINCSAIKSKTKAAVNLECKSEPKAKKPRLVTNPESNKHTKSLKPVFQSKIDRRQESSERETDKVTPFKLKTKSKCEDSTSTNSTVHPEQFEESTSTNSTIHPEQFEDSTSTNSTIHSEQFEESTSTNSTIHPEQCEESTSTNSTIHPEQSLSSTARAESTTRSDQPEVPTTRPEASDVVSQTAPRLAHSLMLSLDGPSSSRSSLLSRPSTTTVAGVSPAPASSQPSAPALSAVPRHPGYRKLRTPKIQHLSSMASIVFADLENFMFFKHFRGQLPPLTFVWGFVSARPRGPFHREKYFRRYQLYRQLKSTKCTHVSTDIGFGKDAVDFAMTLAIAKLDDRLPASIPFYIVSNDGGFREVENQMRRARREVKVVAPRRHCLTSAGFA